MRTPGEQLAKRMTAAWTLTQTTLQGARRRGGGRGTASRLPKPSLDSRRRVKAGKAGHGGVPVTRANAVATRGAPAGTVGGAGAAGAAPLAPAGAATVGGAAAGATVAAAAGDVAAMRRPPGAAARNGSVTARQRAATMARARAATTASQLAMAALRLPRGPHLVLVERNIPVPMPDGVVLLADRYYPGGTGRPAPPGQPPVILVRSPYGRSGFLGLAYGHFFARHGFQAVVQSVRGTFGSGGVFDPLANERTDGLATVEWLRQQSWFGGAFAMHGPSYLGYAQWAIAADAGPELRAMAAQMAASQFHDAAYVGGAFALESTLSWSDLTTRIERPIGGLTASITSVRRARRAAMSGRPLADLDTLAAGAPVPFFQDLLRNTDADGPYWQLRNHSAAVAGVAAPVSLLGGWYDVFLPWQLEDYAQLRRAGRCPRLTIGPWYHADPRLLRAAAADALEWFRAHLLGDASGLPAQPVRLYITGAGAWREYPQWPVPSMREQPWYLQPARALGLGTPAGSRPDTYRYDPADPTPAVNGPTLIGNSEPEDNRRVEARKDVLTFTSKALPDGLEIIGPVYADLYVRSSRAYTDFVVRLCDVTPTGASINVCEGVRRLLPGSPAADGEGVRRVRVELWPAGHRFLDGHRLRVQVSSGAYPRVDRNPGTGEPAGRSPMLPAEQEVFHDPDHPSAILLPVTG